QSPSPRVAESSTRARARATSTDPDSADKPGVTRPLALHASLPSAPVSSRPDLDRPSGIRSETPQLVDMGRDLLEAGSHTAHGLKEPVLPSNLALVSRRRGRRRCRA